MALPNHLRRGAYAAALQRHITGWCDGRQCDTLPAPKEDVLEAALDWLGEFWEDQPVRIAAEVIKVTNA